VCDKETSRTCSHCGLDWFCSGYCEGKREGTHRFRSQVTSPHLHLCTNPVPTKDYRTTADILWGDCTEDVLPTDSCVRHDFGFELLPEQFDQSSLLGLYQDLFAQETSEQVHKWRIEGSLIKNIVRINLAIPRSSRCAYFS